MVIKKNSKRIRNIHHLASLAETLHNKFVISIGRGKIVSPKWIYYDKQSRIFNVFQDDNTEQEIHMDDMFDTKITNIGKAIELECLYLSGK